MKIEYDPKADAMYIHLISGTVVVSDLAAVSGFGLIKSKLPAVPADFDVAQLKMDAP
jgi:hypothetical protein